MPQALLVSKADARGKEGDTGGKHWEWRRFDEIIGGVPDGLSYEAETHPGGRIYHSSAIVRWVLQELKPG